MRLIYVAMIFLVACGGNKQQEAVQALTPEEILEADIKTLTTAFKERRISIPELTTFYLDRIQEIDANGPELHSVLTVNPDAMEIAQQLQQEFEAGNIRGPLHGIPVLIKDNIDTHDKMPTTAGSRALAESFPLQDSYIVKKLRDAGAVIIGKTNLSEWANFRGPKSSSGWSGLGGQTKNPYVLTANPCGSSSGSGVAVSANLCVVAIGTETNGSIVCPSTANGIVGIKPTVGLWSRQGIIPISFTQDTPGPMARNLTDAVIFLAVLAGEDTADPKTSLGKGKVSDDYTQFLKPDGLKGKRIGVDHSVDSINGQVDSLMKEALALLVAQGATLVDVGDIMAEGTDDASFTIMLYEYKDGLNKYFASLGPKAPIKTLEDLIAFNKMDSIEMSFYGQEYLEMALAKGGMGDKEYLEALQKAIEGAGKLGIDKVMDELELDAIVAPTGSPAWTTDHQNGDKYSMGTSSPAAIAGYPSITIPMGFVGELPVGISFYGRAWSEPKLIEAAYNYEQASKKRQAPKFIP